MPELKYKTRGPSPQGRPRVYFACHPGDFSSCFEALCGDVLAISDCAVFYYDPVEDVPADEDYYQSLGQMQLFLFPVTSDLLFTPCRAINVELPFALEHHIPVLPVAFETDLAAPFAEKFGDMEFLNRAKRDDTAIPYEEKLKKYIQSVLVGDELAAKVRAAFDAYIFLSYRKKDRKYAQQLMRLIHQNPFCRDVAIWYDEFLTPGESFNDAIGDALRKSGLFALAVTPNLVSEDNYVARIEYPMAKRADKPILPVEMVPTDREKLREKYDGIPECADPADETALAAALGALALRAHAGDAQHDFFIGLAYLGGIDVEVDHGRALELIGSAAEAGLTEAMEKLASMYHNGEGVGRDYPEEARWLEALAEQAGKKYEAAGDDDSARDYGQRLFTAGKAWYDMRRMEKALSYYLQALRLREEVAGRTGAPGDRERLSHICAYLGDLYRLEHRQAEARAYYDRCLEVDGQLAAESSDTLYRRNLAISHRQMGYLEENDGQYARAREQYEAALAILEQLAGETDSEDIWVRLGTCCGDLGTLCCFMDDLAAARPYYIRALEIEERLLAENDTTANRQRVAACYADLGDLCKQEGNIAGARAYYLRALEIREAAAQELGTMSALRSLSIICSDLGSLCWQENDLAGARQYFMRALQISEQLASQSDAAMNRATLARRYSRMGGLCMSQGDLEQALAYHSKALELRQRLADESGSVSDLSDLSATLDELGRVCMAGKKLAQARDYFLRALAIDQQLAGRSDSPDAQRSLAFSFSRLGDLLTKEKDLAGARNYFTQALAIRKRLADSSGSIDALEKLSTALDKLGVLCVYEEDQQAALDYFLRALAIDEQLAGRSSSVSAQIHLASACKRVGDVLQDMGNLAGARTYFARALAIRERLDAEIGDADNKKNLGLLYNCFVTICNEEGSIGEALDFCRKAVGVFKALYESDPQEFRPNLGNAYQSHAVLLNKRGKTDQAADEFSCAGALLEQLEEESYQERAGKCFYSAGLLYHALGNADRAGKAFRRALDIYRALAARSPQNQAYAASMNSIHFFAVNYNFPRPDWSRS